MATLTHYVLIDAHSGYVWEEADAETPIDACRIVDQKVGGEDREYEDVSRLDGRDGYYVYEAPADWTSVEDGQDRSEIERVKALPLVAEVAFRTKTDD